MPKDMKEARLWLGVSLVSFPETIEGSGLVAGSAPWWTCNMKASLEGGGHMVVLVGGRSRWAVHLASAHPVFPFSVLLLTLYIPHCTSAKIHNVLPKQVGPRKCELTFLKPSAKANPSLV